MCSDSQTQSMENSSHSRPDSATADNSKYSASTLKFALINVRSPTNKTFIINDLITSHKLDCILLTETWLDETGNKELVDASPSNFSFSHCTRSNKKGGVATIFFQIFHLALIIRSVYPSPVLSLLPSKA